MGSSPPTLGEISKKLKKLDLSAQTLIASGAVDPNVSRVELNNTSKIEVTIAAPSAGRYLVIHQIDAGTAGHTVTLTAGTYDGSSTIATFNANEETLILQGISATRFVVVENVGSISLS